MKKTMIFAIMALIAIVLMTAFDVSLLSVSPIKVPENMQPNILYVCPIKTDSAWASLANGLVQGKQFITMGFFFAAMLLAAVWMWALYQNLLKDKFNRDAFKKPWMFTKFLFWAVVIMTVLMKTPDYFRAIEIDGARGQYVLCESSTPGAKIVKNAQWVHDANH